MILLLLAANGAFETALAFPTDALAHQRIPNVYHSDSLARVAVNIFYALFHFHAWDMWF